MLQIALRFVEQSEAATAADILIIGVILLPANAAKKVQKK